VKDEASCRRQHWTVLTLGKAWDQEGTCPALMGTRKGIQSSDFGGAQMQKRDWLSLKRREKKDTKDTRKKRESS
jgi:hypothetical protein